MAKGKSNSKAPIKATGLAPKALPVLPPVAATPKGVNYGSRARNGKGQSNQYKPG
jgi:hypothetical protein